jgi:KDO2-lipid IV(A) lauroyltransferase
MFQRITELLAANERVGLVSDQNAGARGIFVDFFGSKVSAFKGPGLFAVRCGCPVIPLFIVREGYEKHHAMILPEVVIKKTGDAGKDISAYCQAYTAAIEDFVRKYPDHWFWIHKRWKTRPPGEEKEDAPGAETRDFEHMGDE